MKDKLPIYPCSPEAAEHIAKRQYWEKKQRPGSQYPFAELKLGESFGVKLVGTGLHHHAAVKKRTNSLDYLCRVLGPQLKAHFLVLSHDSPEGVAWLEVVRVE